MALELGDILYSDKNTDTFVQCQNKKMDVRTVKREITKQKHKLLNLVTLVIYIVVI